MAREDYRKLLTDRLVSYMEENDGLPWQRGWQSVNVRPFNPRTGTKFKGGNVVALLYGALERNSDDPRWMTLKQANDAGYRVRKHARSALIEYWDWGQPKTRPEVDAEGNALVKSEADGADARVRPGDEEDDERQAARKPKVFHAAMFNGKDIVDLPPFDRKVDWSPNVMAEKLLAASGATIEHRALSKGSGGRLIANAAYMSISTDKVVLPPKSSFKRDADYYATAFHELAHWTGTAARLGRFQPDQEFTPELRAKEELRAEIASMFLASMVGLEGKVQNHAKYVSSWIEVLKGDKHEIFRAARDAEAIVDYLMELAPELKAEMDRWSAGNLLVEPPKRALKSGIEPLPNFQPTALEGGDRAETLSPATTAADAAPSGGVGRADPRWAAFEASVRTEARKYQITEGTVDKTFELLEPQFSQVMDAASANGWTVADMNEMLVRKLVDEMCSNQERARNWDRYCAQVREAATSVMSAEAVELGLQALAAKYQQVLQRAVEADWSTERTDAAVRDLVYGAAGRRAITPEYVKEMFGGKVAPSASIVQSISTTMAPMRYVIPPESIPAALRELHTTAKCQIEDSLANDESSTDDELVAFWATEAGISEAVGREAVKFRSAFFEHPICVMFPETVDDDVVLMPSSEALVLDDISPVDLGAMSDELAQDHPESEDSNTLSM